MTTAVATFLLIVTLSTQGYWLAEKPAQIELAWAAPEHTTDAVLHWRLALDELELAKGKAPFAADEATLVLEVAPPKVRVRTRMRWLYELRAADDDRVLSTGEVLVHVFPDDQLAAAADRLDEPVAVLAEPNDPLASLLKKAKVPHHVVQRPQSLRMNPPSRLLVAENWLAGKANTQDEQALRQLAQRGAAILVFEQTGVTRLMGFDLRQRPAPEQLVWRDQHALWRGLPLEDRHRWLSRDAELLAIELPANVKAVELAHWPQEVEAAQAQAVDALVLTQQVGEGRIVLWQIPLGDWQTDPRSQQLLANALDYLSTPITPTPSPSERFTKPEPKPAAEPREQDQQPLY